MVLSNRSDGKNSIARHWGSGLEFILFPAELRPCRASAKNRTGGKAGEKESAKKRGARDQLRKVRREKWAGWPSRQFARYLLSFDSRRRSNLPPPAKPSILTDRFEKRVAFWPFSVKVRSFTTESAGFLYMWVGRGKRGEGFEFGWKNTEGVLVEIFSQ